MTRSMEILALDNNIRSRFWVLQCPGKPVATWRISGSRRRILEATSSKATDNREVNYISGVVWEVSMDVFFYAVKAFGKRCIFLSNRSLPRFSVDKTQKTDFWVQCHFEEPHGVQPHDFDSLPLFVCNQCWLSRSVLSPLLCSYVSVKTFFKTLFHIKTLRLSLVLTSLVF